MWSCLEVLGPLQLKLHPTPVGSPKVLDQSESLDFAIPKTHSWIPWRWWWWGWGILSSMSLMIAPAFFLLIPFASKASSSFRWPSCHRQVIVDGHCHHSPQKLILYARNPYHSCTERPLTKASGWISWNGTLSCLKFSSTCSTRRGSKCL